MPSSNLGDIISKFPEDREAIERLDVLIFSAEAGSPKEYTFEHLYHKSSPASPESLALILAELSIRGLIEKFIRVESPSTGGGIGDFPHVENVPKEIHDWRRDVMVTVEPDHLKVMFRVRPQADT